jgi:hypothetical protein
LAFEIWVTDMIHKPTVTETVGDALCVFVATSS